jgi:hypothetical protein
MAKAKKTSKRGRQQDRARVADRQIARDCPQGSEEGRQQSQESRAVSVALTLREETSRGRRREIASRASPQLVDRQKLHAEFERLRLHSRYVWQSVRSRAGAGWVCEARKLTSPHARPAD